MKKLFLSVLLLFWTSVAVAQPLTSEEDTPLPQVSDLVHETVDIVERGLIEEFYHEDAYFVKVHFKKFNIPAGVTVRVRNPEGTEVYEYSKFEKDQFTLHEGDDGKKSFGSISISGDTAIVEAVGHTAAIRAAEHAIVTDYRIVGKPEWMIRSLYDDFVGFPDDGGPESTCGTIDNKVPTPCIKDSFPTAYERMRPIAKIFNGGGSMCTAWRVGPNNHMFTNHHCNSTQDHISASESWFYYEYTDCSGINTTTPVKVAGDILFSSDYGLDYALFSVKNFQSIEQFGYFGLDINEPYQDMRMFRGGHGSGRPKLATVEDDTSSTGYCKVDAPALTRRDAGADAGYYCDSIGGSSGSPVLNWDTGRAFALHHYGGCLNSGVKFSYIWPRVSEFFGGQVPPGDIDDPTGPPSDPPVVDFTVACTDLTCTVDASASYDPDGTIETFRFGWGDGTQVTEQPGPVATHEYAATGIYNLNVTAVDDTSTHGSKSEIIAPRAPGENNLPVVSASQKNDGNCGATFEDLSVDYDGEVVARDWFVYRETDWQWTLASTEKVFPYTWPVGGDHWRLRIEVYDNDGGMKRVYFRINPIECSIMNTWPNALLYYRKEAEWGKYTFINKSTDSDGVIDRIYIRVYGSGDNPGPTAVPQYVWDYDPEYNEEFVFTLGEGQYRSYIYAYDNWTAADSYVRALFTVPPKPAPTPPEASFEYTRNLNTVMFEDTSTDTMGVVKWFWEFGDGNTSTEQNPTHTYPAVKTTYKVSLTATDEDDMSDTVTRDVFVNPDPDPVITLSYTTQRGDKGYHDITFNWSGTGTDKVFLHWLGVHELDNDGTETYSKKKKDKNKSAKLCDYDGYCSKTITVAF